MGSYAINQMPLSAAAPATAAYRHDPYNVASCKYEIPAAATAAAAHEQAHVAAPAHPSVLHAALQGFVTFIPYPTESYPVPECEVPREQLVRVFVGQLPYRVTPMQLAWLCDTIAPGAQLYNMETIMKKTGIKAKRLPTGCIHAFALPELADYLIQALSFRVLFDDSGIWFAQGDEELACLQDYCAAMKLNESMRFRDRPYQPVVVQFATSHHGSSSYSPARRFATSTPPPQFGVSPPLTPQSNGYSPAIWAHQSQQMYGNGSWQSY